MWTSAENRTKRASATRVSVDRTVVTATRAASSSGQPKAPADIAGNATARANLIRHPQRLAVAGGEQRRAVLASAPHRADRVNDMSGRQPAAGRGHRLPRRQAIAVRRGAQLPTGRQDLRAAPPVDG